MAERYRKASQINPRWLQKKGPGALMQVQKLVKQNGSAWSSRPLKANLLLMCQDSSEAFYLLSSLAHSLSLKTMGTMVFIFPQKLV